MKLKTEMLEATRRALGPLWKAFACARDLWIDPWEFSLRLEHLLDLGADEAHLRWLALQGYVKIYDRRIMITEAGVLAASAICGHASSPANWRAASWNTISVDFPLPRWDCQRRVLYFGKTIVKRYKRPSPNQDRVLSAFEEEGWPPHVYDPLPPKDDLLAKSRLHGTIDWLNRNQENQLLRFRGDGTGEGVCWERTASGPAAVPTDLPRKLRIAA